MGKFTRISQEAFSQIQADAGTILKKFDPDNPKAPEDSDIVTATTGGINPVCTPTYSDWGEDIDNVPNNMKEFKHLDSWECTLGFTSLSTSPEAIRLALGAADIIGNKIGPRRDLKQADFSDLWWVGDRTDGGFVAVCLKNALSTGGFSLKTTKNGKGQVSVTLTGHVSIPDWVPDWAGGGKTFGFNINEIPHLAKGGIVDRPTIAEIGEAGKEAVIPLENNLGWIDKIAEKLKNVYPVSSGVIIENINVTVNGTEDMDIGREVAEKIAEKLEELQIIQQTAVGGTGWK